MSGENNVAGSEGAACEDKGGACPLCCGLWPASRWGRVIVLAVALAALGVVMGREAMRSDLSKKMARYEALMSQGQRDAAAALLGEIIDGEDALYRARKFDEATRALEWVVDKDPKRAIALERLGVMARDRKDDAAAEAWFKRAAEADPLTPAHFYNLALIHYARKDYAACEASLKSAMKLAPVKSQYRLLYAFCAQDSGAPEDVVKKRYRDTVDAAEAQAQVLAPDDLASEAPLASIWKTAADRLDKLGDSYGWDRLKKLATDAKKSETRDFAKRLLADVNRK